MSRVGNFQSLTIKMLSPIHGFVMYSKNEYAIPNYMTRQVFNIKLNARL
jgi:hypothetical protein